MSKAQQDALDIAKEIVVAKMGNTTISPCRESGESVADFFEVIYKKIAELAAENSD